MSEAGMPIEPDRDRGGRRLGSWRWVGAALAFAVVAHLLLVLAVSLTRSPF
jgi:hypothetical protein